MPIKVFAFGLICFLGVQVMYGNGEVGNTKQLEINSENKNFFFKMSDAEIETFIFKVKKLKKGTDIQEVIEYLGKPYSKHSRKSKKWNEPSKGSCLTYYLKIWNKDSVNELKDNYIILFFNINNKFEDFFIRLD